MNKIFNFNWHKNLKCPHQESSCGYLVKQANALSTELSFIILADKKFTKTTCKVEIHILVIKTLLLADHNKKKNTVKK